MMMDNNWTKNEFDLLDFGDKRLNKRFISLVESLMKSPTSSISQACRNWGDTKAAYRFFQNDKVSNDEILSGHIETTKQRCRDYPVILAIQDTTYFNYTTHSKTIGLGHISKDKNKSDVLGLIMHTTFAVTSEGGLPLGLIDQKIYSRPDLTEEKKKLKGKIDSRNIPIEEKESFRWIEALKKTATRFQTHPAKIVTICDREADIYDLFHTANDFDSYILIRASHNRTVNKKSPGSKVTGEKLWDIMKTKQAIGSISIKVPKQKNKPARIAECSIKTGEVMLSPPRNKTTNNPDGLACLKMYAVYVSEKQQAGQNDLINWMLITNMPVTNPEEALEKIEWYCLRWRIEIFHKILKSGLTVEDCRLGTADRLIRYLAVMSIIARRIYWITLISRVCPDASCKLFLNDFEWKILFTKFNKCKKYSNIPPDAKQAVTWIAMLGGFLNRKGDDNPGIITIWRGLKKFANILEGCELMQKIYENNFFGLKADQKADN